MTGVKLSWLYAAGPSSPLVDFLIRLTALLAVAWLAHALLARANPRWRVWTWRVTATAIFGLAIAFWCGLRLGLPVLPAGERAAVTQVVRVPLTSATPEVDAVDAALAPLLQSPPEPSSARRAIDESVRFLNSSTPTAAAQPRLTVDWQRLALLVWLSGVALCALGEAAAQWKLRALRRCAAPAPEFIREQARRLAERLGWRQPFEVLASPDVASPCVAGLVRPAILLPAADCRADAELNLQAVLAHEVAHVQGGDLAWNAQWRVLAAGLWFHPLVWRVRSAHAAACDAVCDATAAELLGDAAAYGQTLARLALRAAGVAPGVGLAMAQPSRVRRRIEALLARPHVGPLPRMATAAALVVAVCGTVLLATATAIHAEPPAAAPPPTVDTAAPNVAPVPLPGAGAIRLNVSGQVVDEGGKPIAGALVFVSSAGVRVGTSPYCPSCYADCGKRSVTDAEGRFTIAELDPTLVFRLLAIAQGYRPASATKVDPAAGKAVEMKMTARPVPNEPARVVRGKVLDPFGRPAVGAIVEPFGCQTPGKRWWGSMPKVEELAVTDTQGRFAIVCDEPVVGVDLRIEARGAARKVFPLVSSGADEHEFKLEAGTTITGRVLDDGQPLAGISVGVVQIDRGSEGFLGNYEIGTDANGRFTLPNMPENERLVVYGIMKSLSGRGVVTAKEFRSATAATTDLGDLHVQPGQTIKGRIALADGKPLPPRTRVMFSRDKAWDSNFAEADADGSFTISGIPPEVIEVIARVKGYRVSPKNKSFEPLNCSQLKGLVTGDVTDLIVLFEPGETERPGHDPKTWQTLAAKYKRLETQPLVGVTSELEAPPADKVSLKPATATHGAQNRYAALPKIDVPPPKPAPDRSGKGPAKTLRGSVIDAGGRPVPRARLWLPLEWLSPMETLTVRGECDEQGNFELRVPESWLPTGVTQRLWTIWAYAPGHAIGAFRAYRQLYGDKTDEPCRIELPKESDIEFIVQKPDESRAAGAKLIPWHGQTETGGEIVPRELAELVAVAADEEGHVRLPALTRKMIHNVDVSLAGLGTQRFRADTATTGTALRHIALRSAGRVEGRIVCDQLDLVHGMFVSIETRALSSPHDVLVPPTGTALLTVNEDGTFVVPEIAHGRVEIFARCDERLPVRPRLPAEGELVLLEGETAELEIPLERTVPVYGVIRAKDTKAPIAGATVNVQYGVGHQGEQATTDKNGRYAASVLAGDVRVQLIHILGHYAQVGEFWNEKHTVTADKGEFELPPIELVPTIQLAGKLLDRDGEPMADVKIHGVVGNRRYGFSTTDSEGKFTLSGVPQEVTLEKFGVWTDEKRFDAKVESTDPFVVRVK